MNTCIELLIESLCSLAAVRAIWQGHSYSTTGARVSRVQLLACLKDEFYMAYALECARPSE